MTSFNYNALERYAYPIYFLSISLLILVLFTGKVTSGSQRWLSLGPVSFQPSELAKIAILLVLAKFFSKKGGRKKYRLRDLWQPFILIGIPGVLILKEPDLGTSVLLMTVSFSVILFVNVNWKSLVILGMSALSVVPFIWLNLKEYQQMRILTFIRPDMDPLGSGYHINQSKIAIGSGLFWGKGFLKGTQTRLHFYRNNIRILLFRCLPRNGGF